MTIIFYQIKNQLRRDPHIKVKWPPYSKILKDTQSYKSNNLMSIYNTFDIISTIQALKKVKIVFYHILKKEPNTYHLNGKFVIRIIMTLLLLPNHR